MSIASLTIAASATAFGQSSAMGKNNPYSPSPSGKVAEAAATPTPTSKPAATGVRTAPQQVAFVIKDNRSTTVLDDDPKAVAETPKIDETFASPKLSLSPTNIYRIGVGDVLFINLKNSPQGSGYYTVRENGVIDYPLAGPTVAIGSKTTDEAAALLRSSIKLFANPQIEVKVQYYLSRSFTVAGLVDNPGQKVLRRDAMPVFAVRAESEVRREANKVKITRAKSGVIEEYSLSDTATDNIVILAGDTVEFAQEKRAVVAHYTFAGTKKTLNVGTKLSQAVAEALGAKAEPKYAVVQRVNDKGVTTVVVYELKSIKAGKIIDPVLSPGDVIEVRN